MRERQPGSQLLDRLLRGLAVEGHHRGRHAGLPAKLGTPPVADGHHLDLVRTPANGFFEMLNGHLSGGPTFQSGTPVILRRRHVRSSEDDREGLVHSPRFRGSSADPREEKSALSGSPQDFHGSSTGFPQPGGSDEVVPLGGRSEGRMRDREMARVLRILCRRRVPGGREPSGRRRAPTSRCSACTCSTERSSTSYGEFARVDDSVIFSMPVGGRPEEPRIQVTTVKAALVDWPRTDRYSASARYQRYAETRGEEDFRILSNEVALALNDIALSSNRQQALALAEGVRRTVADWPRMHYGYRAERCPRDRRDPRPGDLVASRRAGRHVLRAVARRDGRRAGARAGRRHAERAPAARRDLSRRVDHQGGRARRGAAVGADADREAGSTLSDASALRRTRRDADSTGAGHRPEVRRAVAEARHAGQGLRRARDHLRHPAADDADPEGGRQARRPASGDGAGAEYRPCSRSCSPRSGCACSATSGCSGSPPIASISGRSVRRCGCW